MINHPHKIDQVSNDIAERNARAAKYLAEKRFDKAQSSIRVKEVLLFSGMILGLVLVGYVGGQL